jgi:hypothetical protein
MGAIGNKYLQGQPILPYANFKAYQNTDIFLDLQFVDHTQTPVVPTAISIEIDDLTNSVAMLNPTALIATGSVVPPTSPPYMYYPAFAATSMPLQLGAAIWTMTFPYIGSQICQVGMTFTAVDSVTGQSFTSTQVVAIVELVSVATVSGATP